ncbi:hypothetical protein B0H66DRAFT_271569 [Apodospora peruviana]|uniref:MARVEL domain-containing protein n=1 Tax=Apodospora peruviana TaxID=516989 RepID=A0AAE0HZK3_9PEZI|nr:hypothetical protein B0H66DRAFT_271569 [Apodospora peruviana]
MSEVKVAAVSQQSWADPKAAPGSDEHWVVVTPVWHVVVRGFQAFFGLVILAMAGYLIHGLALDANAFALVCGLFTWIVVGYALITEKVAGARKGYNIWAILSLDLFMAILWLASMGANAALRASFTETVQVTDCFDDGSTVSAHHCTIAKRAAVAGKVGLAVMSAIAGLSALNWLLFIATLVFNGHTFRMYYEANKTPKTTDNATVEMKAQQTPMLVPQQQQQPAEAPTYPQYADQQQQYQSQVPQQQAYGVPSPSPSPAPVYNYTQQPQQQYHEAPGQQPQQYPATGYPVQNHAYQQQQISPASTPAHGQPYYPPAQ